MSSCGRPPTAFRRLAASVICTISAKRTLLTSSVASELRRDSIEYSAHKYGGIVECSNSIAHCRCSRRLSREVTVPTKEACTVTLVEELLERVSTRWRDVESKMFMLFHRGRIHSAS